MLHLTGNISELFNIEGGAATVRKRINKFVFQFFQAQINKIEAEDFDLNKGDVIQKLTRELKAGINAYCTRNGYPYHIHDDITIGDTELDKAYYEALAKKAIAVVTQQALDVDAEALLARIDKIGKGLLAGTAYSDADRLQAAQITLGIVKKDIQFKKFGVDPDTAVLLKAIAEILKK